ncbi:hypothetical protein EB796_024075 [Bugula neritina]|uniref:Uncharacterized protein n=1 Tax=Bugula neritina TaxID=10212 RepID=A0A7J7IW04_BUGNE|nr:hypothetical protein EB796_024075 [Bugula neritina]
MSSELVPDYPDLFIGVYSMTASSSSSGHVEMATSETVQSKWELPTIIAGIVTGSVLVPVIVGVLIYRRRRLSRPMKSDVEDSPNHIVMQVKDGQYCQFGDGTTSLNTVKTSKKGQQSQQDIHPSRPTSLPFQSSKHHHRHGKADRPSKRADHSRTHNVDAGTYPTRRTRKSHRKRNLHDQTVQHNAMLVANLPDPYHIKPEDFVHSTDVLHTLLSPAERRLLASPPDESMVSHFNHELNYRSPSLNRNSRHKKPKRKRHKPKYRKPASLTDQSELDKLIRGLPVGKPNTTQVNADSEYRALINHLSSTGSNNQSELVNTSAEVHPVPHTTPVENTSSELSPTVSPIANDPSALLVNGQRSPCLDDGYNSLANTGSTQSNLSSKGRESIVAPVLQRIREKSGNASDSSVKQLSKELPTRHSTPNSQTLRQQMTCDSGSNVTPGTTDGTTVFPRVLLKPDGASHTDSDSFSPPVSILPPPVESPRSKHSVPGITPPPSHFADHMLNSSANQTASGTSAITAHICDDSMQSKPADIVETPTLHRVSKSGKSLIPKLAVKQTPGSLQSSQVMPKSNGSQTNSRLAAPSVDRPKEGPKLLYKNAGLCHAAKSQSATTSDSYDYDDYLPPPL